jgi:hypothetical protein
LRKTKKSKYYFLAFNQLYASLLAKDCFSDFALFNKGCFFKPYLSVFLNHYFINYYFTILEGIEFKPYFSIFLMQAGPLCYAHKILFKNIFYSENMFLNGLKHCSEH